MEAKNEEYQVYDAKDKILGRLASVVAKQLILGKKVAIINAEQLIISGDRAMIKEKYAKRLKLQEKENPEHSPHWPRRPDMLVKRIVRGMLPYHKKPSGKEAFKRLRVFVGVPDQYKTTKPIEIDTKGPKMLYTGYMRLSDLAKELGYNR